MKVRQTSCAWVLSGDYAHLNQLIQDMELRARRGQDWDYESDGKGLVKFGFASQAIESHFRSVLRHCEASTPNTSGEPRRVAH